MYVCDSLSTSLSKVAVAGLLLMCMYISVTTP